MRKLINTIGLVMSSVVTVLVIVLSLSKTVPSTGLGQVNDKLGHFLAYIAVGFFLQMCFFSSARPLWVRILLPLVLGSALGAAIELVQPFTGRSREWLDFVMDASGALLGALISSVFVNLLATRSVPDTKK
ncbi:MAG: VanZ family protein [Spirochaetales bacterium]|nr:VanZ family protein [Spirochaetales bacterium]